MYLTLDADKLDIMGNAIKLVRLECRDLLIASGIFAGVFFASVLFGTESMKSCLAALILSTFAGCATLLPLILKPNLSMVWVLTTSILRLLLMISGSVIILLFAKVDAVWFIAWIGICYMVLLAVEIRFALRMANRDDV